MNLRRIEREQVASVLEENNTFGGRFAHQSPLPGRIDFAGCSVWLVELAADEHHAQHAAYVVINRRGRYLAGRYFRKHLLRDQPATTVTGSLCFRLYQPLFH